MQGPNPQVYESCNTFHFHKAQTYNLFSNKSSLISMNWKHPSMVFHLINARCTFMYAEIKLDAFSVVSK